MNLCKLNYSVFIILVNLSIFYGDQCLHNCTICDLDTNGHVTKVVCQDVKIQTLPNSLTELWVSDARQLSLMPLGKFQSFILAGKTQLRILSIQRYGIRQLLNGSLSICTNLIVLDLSDNLISNLPVGIFHGLISLKTLNLSKNALTSLDSSTGLFSHLRSLTHLYLGFNKLTRINNTTFRNLTGLSQLGLESNRISTIDRDTFQAVHSLQTINLSNNNLTNMQSELFKGLTKLLRIELNGNLLQILEQTTIIEPSVRLISLSSNKFTEIPTSFLQHLQNVQIEVNLAENQIHNISDSSLDKIHIQQLNLSFNLIEFIQFNAFSDCTISELDLRYNHLKSLQKELERNFFKINTILLDNNPWTCDCSLLWLVEFIKINQSNHSDPVCVEPVKYNGKTMISIATNLSSDCVPTTTQQSTSTQKIITSSAGITPTTTGKIQISGTMTIGIGQIIPGMGQLTPGMGQIIPGMGQITPGMGQITPGMGQITSGMGQITPGMGQITSGMGQITPGMGQENTHGKTSTPQNQPTSRLTTFFASNFTIFPTPAKFETNSSSTEAHDSSSTNVGMIVGISVGVVSLIIVTTALVKFQPWKKIGRFTRVDVDNVE